ncbi:MAG TPA: bifunctional DNA-formamidopyrimidine glycosylase/DNA-(apurinic or apyrimidinic site) lyase [Terriglobales bacterium]|nr:bifunctional DNA-formamidopyrimidine glycosylase/DNA-(apurinic or apyrimidinic site) lyase [Terriglobales bacterium]
MPELPEVETIARGLNNRITGDVIESVWLGSKPEPLKSPAEEIAAALESKMISSVRRVGKHIVFDLRPAKNGERRERQTQWIVHLGMTGSLRVSPPESEIEKHTHAILKLASGRELRFVDPRRFGRLSVIEQFQAPGSEPLDIQFEEFAALFRRRKTPIKSALLNQKLLSGVGNIYADEALFRAKIRPRRRASSLTRDDLRRLYAALKKVLQEAICAGGSSISDYVDADGREGYFQFKHRVYGREDKPCLVCKMPIKRIVIAGRSSHYCPKCQK